MSFSKSASSSTLLLLYSNYSVFNSQNNPLGVRQENNNLHSYFNFTYKILNGALLIFHI